MDKPFIFQQIASYLHPWDLVKTRQLNKAIKKTSEILIKREMLKVTKLTKKLNTDQILKLFEQIFSEPKELSSQNSFLNIIKPASESSADFCQSIHTIIPKNELNDYFWSSTGSETDNANEELILYSGWKNMIFVKELKIKFYKENQFEDGNNYFRSKNVFIYLNLTELETGATKFGPYPVSNDPQQWLDIKFDKIVPARFLKIKFEGKIEIQMADMQYYTCVHNISIKANILSTEAGSIGEKILYEEIPIENEFLQEITKIGEEFELEEQEVQIFKNELEPADRSITFALLKSFQKKTEEKKRELFEKMSYKYQLARNNYALLNQYFSNSDSQKEAVKSYSHSMTKNFGYLNREETAAALGILLYPELRKVKFSGKNLSQIAEELMVVVV